MNNNEWWIQVGIMACTQWGCTPETRIQITGHPSGRPVLVYKETERSVNKELGDKQELISQAVAPETFRLPGGDQVEMGYSKGCDVLVIWDPTT